MELISRDEAMRLLKEDLYASRSRGDDEREEACLLHYIEISNLPTVEERKEGEWIDHSNEGYVECPFCGSCTTCEDNIDELHFCFNCGNELKGE